MEHPEKSRFSGMTKGPNVFIRMNIAKINKIGVTLSLLVLIGSGFFVPLSQINSAFAANLGTIQITVNPANSAPIDNELNAMIVAVLDGDTYLNDPGEYIPDENFTGAQGRTFTITNVPLNGTNTYTIAVAFFKEQQKSVDYSLYTVTSGGATLAPGTQSGSFMANVAGTRSGNTVSYAINIARSNPTISLTTTPPSPTNQSSVTVAGITRKNSTVTVTGGAVTANTTANSSGVFSLNVTLNQNAANALQVKATDTAGAESNIVSASVRHDNTPPVITLSGANPETVEAGSAYVELGATATDSLEGNLTGRISINTSAVNTNALGSYTVRYNVSDTSGNVATEVTRTVNVVDTVIPVITLTGANPQTVEVGSAYTELGATALDNYNGNITANIIVNAGAVNTSALGSYAVTYNISDSSSNVATEKTRTVNVIDTTKPIITLAGANPQTIQVGSPYTELGATASDNYNGNISANIVV
ncbi:MAG: DUF5011 domain-containing protein, partial [Candidatus Wolfebacteria bacterium]|nr:DUF5011 domain-containing protein [Candidatus Wolfebacteria bacterium]